MRILQRSILHEWISELGSVRLVAIEGAKGFRLPITRRLLAAGHRGRGRFPRI
ncbi:MAG: hypothetical protein M5T61_09235 [Acidimicrobiia bacterium]|nr:hypothetical protein [Acidimicrobiia bacterium]